MTYMRSLTIGLRMSLGGYLGAVLTYIAEGNSARGMFYLRSQEYLFRTSVRKVLKFLCSQSDCVGVVWGRYILQCLCACYSYIVSGPSGVVSPNIPDSSARRFA